MHALQLLAACVAACGASWRPLALDLDVGVCGSFSGSDSTTTNATNLPDHSWLRVRFALHTSEDDLATIDDPHMLLVDGAAPLAALSLGSAAASSNCSAATSRLARFDAVFKHSSTSAVLRFGRPCSFNSELRRPAHAWDALWCRHVSAWGVADVLVETSAVEQLAWAPPLLESAAPVDSRLVVAGGGGFALPPSLDALQHLSVLPTSQAGDVELSGTLPAALRSLTIGFSTDRTNIDSAWEHSQIDPPAQHAAPLSLSGTLPAMLENLVWLLDEVPARLSGTLPASLRLLDAAGLIGEAGTVALRPLISGTLPAELLHPSSSASCSEPLFRDAHIDDLARNQV